MDIQTEFVVLACLQRKTYRIRKVNITMDVFFDGTKNNKYNIDFGDNIKKGWGT